MRRTAIIVASVAAAVIIAIVVVLGLRTPVPPTASPSAGGPSGIHTPTPPATAEPADPADPATTNAQLFAGGLYRDLENHAVQAQAKLADENKSADAALINRISSQPTAVWLGDHQTVAQLKPLLATYVANAKADGSTLTFVTYAIPNRDCGGLSGGGLSAREYLEWNRAIAAALTGSGAVVLVEPDSVAQLSNDSCAGEEKKRIPVLKKAIEILANAGLTLYLDGGGSHWVQPAVMAKRLNAVGIERARGFFTNVSNYYRVDEERSYANRLSALVGDKFFVIDVSRNGNGWQGHWCNPKGAAIGQDPHVSEGTSKLDALLWVKHPGDSDGSCNGGPPAGQWWQSYALDLVRNSDR